MPVNSKVVGGATRPEKLLEGLDQSQKIIDQNLAEVDMGNAGAIDPLHDYAENF